jgi:zinc transporter, ZIP family
MLPTSKKSLIDGGFSPKQASWTLIACFLGGVLGIQVLSRIMHQFMPSHVVDCEHSHDSGPGKENGHIHEEEDGHDHETEERPVQRTQTPLSSLPGHMMTPGGGRKRASTQTSYFSQAPTAISYAPTEESETNQSPLATSQTNIRRPSLQARMSTTLGQLATGMKPMCDCNGPCYGYSDPCGNECFKNINARGGYRASLTPRSFSGPMKPPLRKTATLASTAPLNESTPLLGDIAEETRPAEQLNQAPTRYFTVSERQQEASNDSDPTTGAAPNGFTDLAKTSTMETTSSHQPEHHHHHVPMNAFLSIGLQTSIAIALHKLPEGFITYATNHANPKLGVSVFLALFIHNITEGFAMALPLYLAINSRVKAMFWSFVLGGLSQPIGAGVAAIWFKIAGQGNWAPSEGVYGGMFAVTAGIMASVALQLFSESLDLTHSRTLCMLGAFSGMGILGISSALTA